MNFQSKYYEVAAGWLARGLGNFLTGPFYKMFKLITDINKSSLEVKRLKKILIMQSNGLKNEDNNLGQLILRTFSRHIKVRLIRRMLICIEDMSEVLFEELEE